MLDISDGTLSILISNITLVLLMVLSSLLLWLRYIDPKILAPVTNLKLLKPGKYI